MRFMHKQKQSEHSHKHDQRKRAHIKEKEQMNMRLKKSYFDTESSEVYYLSEKLGKIERNTHVCIRQFVGRMPFTQFIKLTYSYYTCPLRVYLFTKMNKILTMVLFITVFSIILNYLQNFNKKVFRVVLVSRWMAVLIAVMLVYQTVFFVGAVRHRYKGYLIFKYVYRFQPQVKFARILRCIKAVFSRHYDVKITRKRIKRIISFEDDLYAHLVRKETVTNVFYTTLLERLVRYLFPLDQNTITRSEHTRMKRTNYLVIAGLVLCSPILCTLLLISRTVDMISTGSSLAHVLAYDYSPLSIVRLRRYGVLPHVYKAAVHRSYKHALRMLRTNEHGIARVLMKCVLIVCSTTIFVLVLVLLKMFVYQRGLLNLELIQYRLELQITRHTTLVLRLIDIIYIIGFLFYIKNSINVCTDRTYSTKRSFKKWTNALKTSAYRYSRSSHVLIRAMMKRRIVMVLRECAAPFVAPWQLLRINARIEDFYERARRSFVFRRTTF